MPNYDPWLGPDDPAPWQMAAPPVAVYRVPQGATSSGAWQLLDNVQCQWVQDSEGTDPGQAGFVYVFGGEAGIPDPDAPQSIEAALSTDAWSPKTVNVYDRLVVVAQRPDGVTEYLFDGYALDFGLHLGAAQEEVDFYAVGRAWNLWSQVVAGAYLRDADDMINGSGYQSSVIARTNPKGVANCVPAGGEREVNGVRYPVFVDPAAVNGPNAPRLWKLADIAKYLAWHHNAAQTDVTNPTTDRLDAVLIGREPIPGTPFDPDDPSTYTQQDLIVPDKPLTGHGWPDLLWRYIGDKGFGMAFRLADGGDGPQTSLDVYVQQAGNLQDLWLAARGTTFDPRLFNVQSGGVRRETHPTINQWLVEGGLVQYEASFVLWPLFPMTAADGASPTSILAFDRSQPGFLTSNRNAYRLYGVDELNLGTYCPGTSTADTGGPCDFSGLFGTKDYAVRRRPPKGGNLITTDKGTKRPIRCRLDYATGDYLPPPGLWDGSALADAWKPVSGGYELRKDQLGIWISRRQPQPLADRQGPDDGRADRRQGGRGPVPGMVLGAELRPAADLRDRGGRHGPGDGRGAGQLADPLPRGPDHRRPAGLLQAGRRRELAQQHGQFADRRPRRHPRRHRGRRRQPDGHRVRRARRRGHDPLRHDPVPGRRPHKADQRPRPGLPHRRRRRGRHARLPAGDPPPDHAGAGDRDDPGALRRADAVPGPRAKGPAEMSDCADEDMLRYDDDDDRDDFGRLDPASAPVGMTVLAQTTTVSGAPYPTAAGQFVPCTTLAILGAETSGGAGSTTSLGDTFYAYIPTGAPVPTSGSQLVCVCVPYRWIADI